MIKNYYSSKNQEGFYSKKSDAAKNCWRYRFLSVLLPILFLLVGDLAIAQVSINETFNTSTTPTGWVYSGFSQTTSVPCLGAGAIRKNQYDGSASNETGSAVTSAWTSNGQNLNISFDYKLLNWTSGTPTVATPNSPEWGAIITEVSIDGGTTYSITAGTITPSNHTVSTTCSTVNYVVPGTSLPSGNNIKVRFRLAYSAIEEDPDYYVYMDNVILTQQAVTPPNCATGLVPADMATAQPTNTVLSWTAATGGATSYDVYLGTTSNPALSANVTTTSYNPGVLAANTTYYWKVIAKNANGDAVGCSQQTFTTGAGLVYCSPSASATATYINNFSTTGGVSNISNLASGFTTGGYQDNYATQVVSQSEGSAVSFTMAVVGGTLGASIWVDWNNNGFFESGERLYSTTGYTSGPITGSITVPASTPQGNYRMRVYVDYNNPSPTNACTSGTRLEGEDYKFTVTAPPACLQPSALTATAITGSGATLGWTSSEGMYNVEYGVSGFTQGTGTMVPGLTATTYAVSGLNSATAYQFYVQSDCTTDGLSTWAGPFSFTTLIANDLCSGATVVTCGTSIATTLVGSTNESQPVCGISGVPTQNSGGLWYKFIGTGDDVTVSTGASATNVDTRLAVFSGACGTLTCLGGNDDISGTNYRSEVLFGTDLGTEYYILLYSFSTTSPSGITLTVSCQAPCAPETLNDECSAPYAVVIGTPLTANNTCSSPSSGVAYPSAGSSFGTYYDSWYSFNSGSNTSLSIAASATAPTVVGFALYTGACGTLTQVTGSSNLTGAKITLTSLTANTDYFVRVYSSSPAARGEFTLSVALPTTTIAAADCGTTKEEVGYESIDAVAVTGAQDYEFRIVNGSFSATVVSPDTSVFFSEFAGFQYGTTYDVSVRAKFAGVYGEYGPTCQVSTTATPLTEMQFLCDDVLPAVNSKVYFKGVPLATAYRYEVTNNTTNDVVVTESAYRYFYMNTLSNFSYGTEFSVRAQVEVDGTFMPYGPACDVTTPAAATQLRAAYCGITLASITTNVYANYVTGATAYKFRATNGATVQEYTTTTAEPKFAISMLAEALINTTYSIEVAAQVGGVWSPYGAACNVTTPASLPLTKLRDAYCGVTLSAINANIYANYATGATQYRFRVTEGANVQTIEVSEPKFMLTQLASVNTGTTYSIDVAYETNGVWGTYGPACNVTTPAAPLTKLRDAYCGVTLGALNANIYAKSMVGATGFRFKVSDGTTEEVYETTGMLFRLTYLSTIVPQNGTTYSISVAYNNGTTWSAYGDVCSVTTPASPIARPSVSDATVSLEKLQVKAYPNPFTDNFTIGLNLVSEQSSEIYIYDMTGKMIERKILDANQLEQSGLGSNLPTGIYNVQVIQGNQVYNLKVMKK